MLLPQGHWVTLALAVCMTVMTVWSGVSYFLGARDVFREDRQ